MAATPTPSLRFEGGDTIVRLSTLPEDTLILHSTVLKAASPRFRARMSGSWAQNNTSTVEHPQTKEQITLYTYRMIYDEDAFTISDEKRDLEVSEKDRFCPLYESSLCSGLSSMPPDNNTNSRHFRRYRKIDAETALSDSIRAHKVLFALAYQLPVQYEKADSETVLDFANVVGLAEYYDMLPAVAADIESALLGLEGLWQDISVSPTLYLCIGIKLRSAEIFGDALRHFIGQGGRHSTLLDRCDADKATLSAFARAKEDFDCRTEDLLKDIRQRCLTHYRPHANAPTASRRGIPVRTNFLDASFSKSLGDKCQFIARAAFREWFDQQLVGEAHWSHVKHSSTHPKDGSVEPRGFRKACELLIAATSEDKYDINAIGRNIAGRYASIFALREQKKPGDRDPAAIIAGELRGILSDCAWWAEITFLNVPEQRAHHDEGLTYFTAMEDVYEEHLPWYGLREWEVYEAPTVQQAEVSEEWLQVIGAPVEGREGQVREPVKIIPIPLGGAW